MSATNLSTGPAVRASGLPVEVGSKTAATDAGAQSGFPDLLNKMAAAGDRAPSQPAISVTERRWAWGRAMSQAAPAREEASKVGEPRATAQPADESDPPTDAASQASASPQPAGPSPLDALAIANAAPLSGVSQDFPGGQGRLVFRQASTADAGAPTEASRDARALSIDVLQGGRERRDVPASPLPPTADVATLQATSRDARAVVSGGAAAAQLVTVIGQETHFAPVVQPVLALGVHADDGAAPEQGTGQGDTPPHPARAGVLAVGTSLRSSSEPLTSVARSSSQQGAAGSGSVELDNSASGADDTLSGLVSEPARMDGAVGQAAAPAASVRREEAGNRAGARERADPPGRIVIAGNRPPSQPATAVAEQRWFRGGAMAQAAPAHNETSNDSEPTLTVQTAGVGAASAYAGNEAPALQQAADPASLETNSIAGTSRLPSARRGFGQAATGAAASQDAPLRQDRLVVPQAVTAEAGTVTEPRDSRARGIGVRQSAQERWNASASPLAATADTAAPTPQDLRARSTGVTQSAQERWSASASPLISIADAAAPKEMASPDSRARSIGVLQSAQERWSASASPLSSTGDSATPMQAPPEDLRARGIGVPQGAQERRDVPASTPAADAATLQATLRDARAVGGAAAAAQPASLVGQATRIAPVVQTVLAQGGRSRAERAAAAGEGAVPEQSTESGDTELLPARAGVVGAGRSLRPSPDRPVVARASSEQDAAGNGEAEAGSSAPPADHSVTANESPRTFGVVPAPTHQVAGQIVAAANTMQSEGAQPTAALGAKPAVSSVVRVLHLELQPADLGNITIRMSLKQDGLDVRVEASQPDTARLLQRDQDTLAKLLTTAGYRIDGMTVVTAPTDSAVAPDGRSQGYLPSSTPQQGGSSQSDSRPSGGRPNAEPDPRTSRGNQNDDNTDKRRTVRGAGGDLYV